MTVEPPPSVRVYRRVRTAHLERLAAMYPAELVYNDTRYDFDPSVDSSGRPRRRLSRVGVVMMLARRSFRVIELGEPAVVGNWPDLLGQLAAIRLRDLVTRRRSRVVTYCIGLADPALEVSAHWHLGQRFARLVTRFMLYTTLPRFDRVAFGTTGSREMYETYVDAPRIRSKQFEALPAPCDCSAHVDGTRSHRVAFVGAFTERKGIVELMAAWEVVRRDDPTARLDMIGKGPLTERVFHWAGDKAEVQVSVDPPRDHIHATLRNASTLVLLSQPVGHWREQIGLPILEGLAHGCEIVTTTETGLASWLVEHGHQVVAPDATPEATAAAISRALAHERADPFDSLPQSDQRIAADHWMFR